MKRYLFIFLSLNLIGACSSDNRNEIDLKLYYITRDQILKELTQSQTFLESSASNVRFKPLLTSLHDLVTVRNNYLATGGQDQLKSYVDSILSYSVKLEDRRNFKILERKSRLYFSDSLQTQNDSANFFLHVLDRELLIHDAYFRHALGIQCGFPVNVPSYIAKANFDTSHYLLLSVLADSSYSLKSLQIQNEKKETAVAANQEQIRFDHLMLFKLSISEPGSYFIQGELQQHDEDGTYPAYFFNHVEVK